MLLFFGGFFCDKINWWKPCQSLEMEILIMRFTFWEDRQEVVCVNDNQQWNYFFCQLYFFFFLNEIIWHDKCLSRLRYSSSFCLLPFFLPACLFSAFFTSLFSTVIFLFPFFSIMFLKSLFHFYFYLALLFYFILFIFLFPFSPTALCNRDMKM